MHNNVGWARIERLTPKVRLFISRDVRMTVFLQQLKVHISTLKNLCFVHKSQLYSCHGTQSCADALLVSDWLYA